MTTTCDSPELFHEQGNPTIHQIPVELTEEEYNRLDEIVFTLTGPKKRRIVPRKLRRSLYPDYFQYLDSFIYVKVDTLDQVGTRYIYIEPESDRRLLYSLTGVSAEEGTTTLACGDFVVSSCSGSLDDPELELTLALAKYGQKYKLPPDPPEIPEADHIFMTVAERIPGSVPQRLGILFMYPDGTVWYLGDYSGNVRSPLRPLHLVGDVPGDSEEVFGDYEQWLINEATTSTSRAGQFYQAGNRHLALHAWREGGLIRTDGRILIQSADGEFYLDPSQFGGYSLEMESGVVVSENKPILATLQFAPDPATISLLIEGGPPAFPNRHFNVVGNTIVWDPTDQFPPDGLAYTVFYRRAVLS